MAPSLKPSDCFFFAVLAAELFLNQQSAPLFRLHYCSKATLVPVLLLIWWAHTAARRSAGIDKLAGKIAAVTGKGKGSHWASTQGVPVALFLAWVGDILLLWDNDKIFFLGGICCFFFAHVVYVYIFVTLQPAKLFAAFTCYQVLVPVGILSGSMYQFIYPFLGDLNWPVFCYLVVITLMSTTAGSWHFNRPAKEAPNTSVRLVFLGTLLFTFSDSILAFSKFAVPLPGSDFYVMLTYGFAQWCIVRGLAGV